MIDSPRPSRTPTNLAGLTLVLACAACSSQGTPSEPPDVPAPSFRLRVCSEEPILLEGPPDVEQTRGCVAKFSQSIGGTQRERRYLVYAPENLPDGPVPLVLSFPGYSVNAEAAAFYDTHARFESLADEHGFVVVYGNGLPDLPSPREQAVVPEGGFLQGCLLPSDEEGIDVTYVRRIVSDLEQELALDKSRIYATGLSAGGGMALQLALEAPDLVAAVAPVAPLPFQPSGIWLHGCKPRPGYERVSIAMLAATDDPFISFGPGSSREYPEALYPGMEATRDVWLAALGLEGPAEVDQIPDSIDGDSYEPDTQRTSSTVERQRFGPGEDGRELWFYKAVGMGHAWPNPIQIESERWPLFGKTNQDLDFAEEAWAFFQRHPGASPE